MKKFLRLLGLSARETSVYIDEDALERERLEQQRIEDEERAYKAKYDYHFDIKDKLFDPHRQKKLHPVIEWSPFEAMEYPDAVLTESIHFLTSAIDYRGRKVSGKFYFYPPVGTRFEAGVHELTVRFVPTNTFKYQNMTLTRDLTVHKRKPWLEWNPPVDKAPEGRFIFLYRQSLPVELFDGVTCELDLTSGKLEFSHYAALQLSVGKHKFTVEYTPGVEHAGNYTRAYASIDIEIGGVAAPMTWILPMSLTHPSERFNGKRRKSDVGGIGLPVVYGDPLPFWIYCAYCEYEDCLGDYEYNPPMGSILSAGRHEITATLTPYDKHRYRRTEITRTIFIHQAVTELEWDPPLGMAEGEGLDELALKCRVVKPIPDLPGRFEYEPKAGTVLKQGTHTLSVQYFPDDANYTPAAMTTTINIFAQRKLILQWFEPEEIEYPTRLTKGQLNAAIIGYGANTLKGDWIYDPPEDSILPAGEHELHVAFHPYKASVAVARSSVKLIVMPTVSKLVWNTPDSILEGEGLFDNVLNCKCTNVNEGRFLYKPPSGSILDGGTHKLFCRFEPTDTNNYLPTEKTVKILVRQRPRFASRLQWSDPVSAPIIYGTSLSGVHLNARCNNAYGIFTYSPEADTLLSAGEHILTGTFTPENPDKVLAGTITSTIEVLPRKPILTWQPEVIDLVYGEELSATKHCNAVVLFAVGTVQRVEGEIIFSPPIGTILGTGDHTISCSFIPSDTLNYLPVDGEDAIKIQFFVHRAIPQIVWNAPVHQLRYPVTLQSFSIPQCADPSIKGHFVYDFDIGRPLFVGKHVLACRYFPNDIVSYLTGHASIELEVIRGIPNIIWTPDDFMLYELPITVANHCNATVDIDGGTFIYNPPAGTIPDAGEKVRLEVKYIPDNEHGYEIVSAVRTIQVGKRRPVLEWHGLPQRMHYSIILSEKHLNAHLSEQENTKATLENLKDGIFVYDPPLGTIPKVGKDQRFTATFKPPPDAVNNYDEVPISILADVLPKVPDILWKAKFLSMIEGNALDKKHHCNAIISSKPKHLFSGRFEYNPPAGTVLPPGRHKVTVTFYPSNEHDVHIVTQEQTFDVTKKAPKIVWETDPLSGRMVCVKKADSS